MKVGIDPKLASNAYKNIAEQPKEKDGKFAHMVNDIVEGMVEQSRQAESTAIQQTQNSVSSGDFAAMSLNIKDLDMNLKAMIGMRDNIVKALNQLQQMPM